MAGTAKISVRPRLTDPADLPDLPAWTGADHPPPRLLGTDAYARLMEELLAGLPNLARFRARRLTERTVVPVRFQWPIPNLDPIPTPETNKERLP